ncbi:MAG: hypothetical protein HQK78_14445 [Desulfobacterales bacterium]|nr:hypothetical protein [Desulfobacterales bacterium]
MNFEQEVEQYQKENNVSKAQAVRHVAKTQPDLHKLYIANLKGENSEGSAKIDEVEVLIDELIRTRAGFDRQLAIKQIARDKPKLFKNWKQ